MPGVQRGSGQRWALLYFDDDGNIVGYEEIPTREVK